MKHKGIDITVKIEKCLFDPYQLRPSWISEMDMFKEADDLIGEYIEENPMGKITIFSTDGDMYQFLNRENVSLHNFTKTITKQEIEDKIGLPIGKYVSWKTLVGDSSDNLPGMRGYGPQRAKNLLQDYKSFQTIPIWDYSLQWQLIFFKTSHKEILHLIKIYPFPILNSFPP